MRVIDWDRVRGVAQLLKQAPQTIEDIQQIGKVTKRTAYRWLDIIEESGGDIVRRARKGQDVTFQLLGDCEIEAA